MGYIFRYIYILLILCFFCPVSLQSKRWKDIYKVKKKDTLYGIAQKYGITLLELVKANPEMNQEGYTLKKDDIIFIPIHLQEENNINVQIPDNSKKDIRKRAINIGVLLPLHNVDGDGKRMIEYYRGMLIGCDSLKEKGISTNIKAWNVPIKTDIKEILKIPELKSLDVIFGPLYSSQVDLLADYCKANKIKLVIPFSINSNVVLTNKNIFQIWQSPDKLYNQAIAAFLERFSNHHPVFVDCNDSKSEKGVFTAALRNELDKKGISYNLTNLKTNEELFSKAFSRVQPNVVILNSAGFPELNVALAKINALTINYPNIVIKLFGYTEWLMYTKYKLDTFFKYDTYIPTTFYYNPLSKSTQGFENNYRRWFHSDMQEALPRFAITGYDHVQFFLRGLHEYGDSFNGSFREVLNKPLQSPLRFKRFSNGGYENATFMLVHYRFDHRIEAINY